MDIFLDGSIAKSISFISSLLALGTFFVALSTNKKVRQSSDAKKNLFENVDEIKGELDFYRFLFITPDEFNHETKCAFSNYLSNFYERYKDILRKRTKLNIYWIKHLLTKEKLTNKEIIKLTNSIGTLSVQIRKDAEPTWNK